MNHLHSLISTEQTFQLRCALLIKLTSLTTKRRREKHSAANKERGREHFRIISERNLKWSRILLVGILGMKPKMRDNFS